MKSKKEIVTIEGKSWTWPALHSPDWTKVWKCCYLQLSFMTLCIYWPIPAEWCSWHEQFRSLDVHLASCWLCYSMAKAQRSSFGQKISHISRIFPWNDAPDPVITSFYAMLLLIPASAPQVPGQIHTKLLFYATEPQPVPTWQISIIFKFRWPTGHRLYAGLVPVHHWTYCAKRMTSIKRGKETEVRKGRETYKQRGVWEIKPQTKRQRKQ